LISGSATMFMSAGRAMIAARLTTEKLANAGGDRIRTA
jgi:hypothetical protein